MHFHQYQELLCGVLNNKQAKLLTLLKVPLNNLLILPAQVADALSLKLDQLIYHQELFP